MKSKNENKTAEKPITEAEREECRIWRRKTVAQIFEMEQLGILKDCLKGMLRDVRTPAMYNGNTLDISVLFKMTAWYREIAPYALPNGETLDFTRAEIEEYFGEPVDWNSFCGLDKKRGSLALIEFFRPLAKGDKVS